MTRSSFLLQLLRRTDFEGNSVYKKSLHHEFTTLSNISNGAKTRYLFWKKTSHSVKWGGRDDFWVTIQAGGATAKLQEPGWGHIQGEMILGSQAGGELLYHDELLVFPQNASP